ncbi:MAG: hypothetical protein E6G97_01265 [Alphaproteobacteria bacterium]|nr:MAG: hypothetical protein E6G97_01265 [Alphaproteobacteria bacterium]
MKLTRVGLLSLVCVGGAVAFGVAANAALDLVLPVPAKKAEAAAAARSAEPAEQPAASYTLASASSTPADFAPVKVKTIPMVYREDRIAEFAAERPANVPLPRPRPASAPMALASTDASASLAHQPGTLAIAAATRKAAPDDGEVLGAAGIERMKTALALTAEQEEYWPAIAAELRALGKVLKLHKGRDGKINVDDDTIQRLYWAAAPLLTRLSYEQKMKVKQMAHVMGLHQVAEAL